MVAPHSATLFTAPAVLVTIAYDLPVFICALETFTVRSPPESLEAEKDHQSQQSCENTTQIKKIHKG